ncbi:MFS transporter [Mycolicibacterium sp. 3033]|nr:MFS transporter [Mycolicibacterium aurantiacum]
MILIIAAFVSMLDRSVMPPLVPVIADDMGVEVAAIGRSLTFYAISYAACQLIWSSLAARYGRVRILVASTALGAIANVVTALAPDALSYNASRMVAGAAFAATITTALIYYGDTLPIRQRAVATANLAAAISLGLAGGTLGAGAIAQWWGWRPVYVVVALAAFALTGLLARMPEAIGTPGERLIPSMRRLATDRWAVSILVFTALEGVLLVGVFNYLAVALQAAGESVLAAGLATAAFGAAVVLISQLMKLVLARWPAWLLMALAGAAIVTAYAAVTVEIAPLTVTLAATLLGLAWALGHTTMQTWMTDAVADSRPIGMSLFSIALFTGASAGAAVGNAAAASDRFSALFAVSAAGAVLYAVSTTVARNRYVLRE